MKRFNSLFKFIPVVLLIASCSNKKEEVTKQQTDMIPVKVMALDHDNGGSEISVSGQFTTDDETNLSFKTGGIISKIMVKEGDAIHKGQVLAMLNLTEISAGVEQAKLAFEKATRDYQRTMNLYKDSVATLEQTQNAKTALDLARQQLNTVQFNLNYSEIRATGNGFVLHKLANEGQVVSAGTPVIQTNGAHAGNWMLRVGVSDKEWQAIAINDKAQISAGTDGKYYDGIVNHRSEGVDAASGSFLIDIKFAAAQPPSLASGMFGKARIMPGRNTAKTTNTVYCAIPYEALLDGDGSSGYVFVTNDNRTATKVKVTIAGIEKDKVIISDGLQGAGSLIISGSAYLTDKSPIKIIQ